MRSVRKASIGTITLNPSIDQNWEIDDLVKDDANRARAVIETAGGKGINVSKVARELGVATRAYALLGGMAGNRLAELAKPLDFPLVPVPIRGNTRINVVLTDIDDATQTRVSAPGPTVGAKELKALLRVLRAARPRPTYWAFGGSLPKGLPAGTYRDLIRVLQKHGTPCVLDTDDESLKLGVQAKPFMIKPNEFEMQRLCGRKLSAVRDYLREARKLADRGIRLVVVSLGARGALFVTRSEGFSIGTPAVKVRSKVGAGDSLIGGLLSGLCRGLPLREAAKLGIAASTSAVMREAPRLCLRSDIAALVRRLRVTELEC